MFARIAFMFILMPGIALGLTLAIIGMAAADAARAARCAVATCTQWSPANERI